MQFDFRLPKLSGSGSTEKDIAELRSYLFQLVQALKIALGSSDGAGTDSVSGTSSGGSTAGKAELLRQVRAQLEKDFLPKSRFNAYFRVGLLGEDSEGQHYGVDIGKEDEDGNFSRAIRMEPGRLEFGGFIIRETDDELTIE